MMGSIIAGQNLLFGFTKWVEKQILSNDGFEYMAIKV
jgi:hypothetical protein